MVTGFSVILGAVFMVLPDDTGTGSPTPTPGPFYICLFNTSNIKLESAYTSMSMSFDFHAFITIVFPAYRSLCRLCL